MLATQLAINSGHQIKCLAAFACPNCVLFDPIDLHVPEMAAQCMQIPLKEFHLGGDRDSTLIGLHEALSQLKRQYGLQGVVCGAGNDTRVTRLMESVCADLRLEMIYPLHGIKQRNVLYAALKNRYKVLIVKTEGYKPLLGTVLDEHALEDPLNPELLDRASAYATGSIILDTPLFRKKINVVETAPIREGTAMKLLLTAMVFENK
jgi:diphthamide synthase (EF-2-diphthine--ammonia ligase)